MQTMLYLLPNYLYTFIYYAYHYLREYIYYLIPFKSTFLQVPALVKNTECTLEAERYVN